MVGYQRGINYMCSISYPVVMEGKDGIIPNLECHVLNNSMVSATGKMQCEIRNYLVKWGSVFTWATSNVWSCLNFSEIIPEAYFSVFPLSVEISSIYSKLLVLFIFLYDALHSYLLIVLFSGCVNNIIEKWNRHLLILIIASMPQHLSCLLKNAGDMQKKIHFDYHHP